MQKVCIASQQGAEEKERNETGGGKQGHSEGRERGVSSLT